MYWNLCIGLNIAVFPKIAQLVKSTRSFTEFQIGAENSSSTVTPLDHLTKSDVTDFLLIHGTELKEQKLVAI